MASSDNLASFEPWLYRPNFPSTATATDFPWLSVDHPFSDSTTTFNTTTTTTTTTTPASDDLSSSFLLADTDVFFSDALSEILRTAAASSTYPTIPLPTTQPDTPSLSAASGSGSDPETTPSLSTAPTRTLQSTPTPLAPSKKPTKRKPRATKKKSSTTFITADAANFRQMVQQVTGVRLPLPLTGTGATNGSVLKPEPYRIAAAGGRVSPVVASGCLPTLDTSASLLSRHHQAMLANNSGPKNNHNSSSSSSPGSVAAGGMDFKSPEGAVAGDGIGNGCCGGGGGGGGGGGYDFDSFSCFPTLESWGKAHVEY